MRSCPRSLLVCLAATACGGQVAQATAEEPTAETTEPPAQAAAPAVSAEPAKAEPAFPDRCADDNAQGVCGPPADFVQEICSGLPKPDVALVLFGKGAPWT